MKDMWNEGDEADDVELRGRRRRRGTKRIKEMWN